MPVRVKCILGIGGRLAGPPEANGPVLAEVRKVLSKDAPAKRGAGWPAGLATPDWQISFWDSAAEIGGETDQETRVGFRVELNCRLDGTIYDSREELAYTHFRWFSHYRDAVWHKDLKARLEELNHDIAKRFGAEKLIEKIWFRQWEFYCGNGGDH
jgi:hypothetical protein